MNLKQISLKFLLSKKKYSYTNISLYLSIFSSSFAVAVTLIVISMSRGYRVEVENSLMSIEPDLIITQKSRNYIDPFYIDTIYSLLEENRNYNLHFSKFLQEYAMLKSGSYSKGVLIYSIYGNISDFYTSIDHSNRIKDEDEYFFLSNNLLNKFDLSIKSKINIFNIDKLIDEQTIRAKEVEVTNIYNTNIPTFDNNIIFLSGKNMKDLFNHSQERYTGILIKGTTPEILKKIESGTKNFPIKLISWREKHDKILYWLTIFSNPIYLILFFMIFLATMYQVFANWLIFHDKSKSIYRLKLLGVSNKIIKNIYNIISFTILLISLISGYLLSIIFSFIQNKYNIIELDPNVYILSKIQSISSFSDFIFISFFTFTVILLSNVLSVKNQISKMNNTR